MNRIMVSLLALVFLTASSLAQAESKIGYVNTQRILADAPQAAKAKKKIEKEFEKRDQELNRMAKQLQAMQETLEKSSITLSEADRRNKEREFGDVSRRIRGLLEVEKFDLILQDVIFASTRIDITDRVIKILGEPAGK